ncbi:MAG: long-chain fatty acid--CoA ligase [Deltaproteobacteria bacterium]|nr:long-chain fatty acid--CoA ligase [Candidatus Anaeroferrophillus wilburensis]MBN2888745.1 long-chain fatty acid--CoA ligase [Deltaproteobacteria bacterium]
MNLVQMFFDRVNRYGDDRAMMVKKAGQYSTISWNEWARRVNQVAAGLLAVGIKSGDRIGILSENRPEWAFADLGILSCGALDVPVYPTNRPTQLAYLMNNSEAVLLFVSSAEQLQKALEAKPSCPALSTIVVFDDIDQALLASDGVVSLAAFEAEGIAWLQDNPGRLEEARSRIDENDLATIMYTSGTTGDPKGVMLTHRNFYSNCVGAAAMVEVNHDDIALSHLPLSHVLERMAGYYLMIYAGATIAYAEAIDTVPLNMAEVAPTIMISVPRLFEKIYGKIYDAALHSSGLKKRLMFWAFGVATQVAACHDEHRQPGAMLALQYKLATKLIFSKMGEKLGGRIRFFVSGGAPLPRKIAEFFYAVGYYILEGYGLTETSPVLTVNTPEALKFGTVGRVIPEVQVKIADDGEILAKGPNITQGYYKNPEATKEVFVDGWFCTGDVGELDDEGFLRITDRKKDLIVTAGGKNIAPQHLENLLKMDKYISDVMLHGDQRKFISALVVPNYEKLEEYALKHDILYTDVRGLLEDPEILRMIERRIAKVHQENDIPGYEQVKKFIVLGSDFSMDMEEVTPTLKLRRKVVTSKFQQQLDALYED